MQILMFSGSLRQNSLNKKLGQVAVQICRTKASLDVNWLNLSDFPLPVFNEDIEMAASPEKLKNLASQIIGAQALIISTPEYNGSISSPLKNMIDWVSRQKPQPWQRKKILLLSASPSSFGGVRGLNHSRVPFEALGAYVFPEVYSLPQAHLAFDE